jgi:hypothetical protein
MDRATFENRLRSAAEKTVLFAQEHVWQTLHDDIVFLICPNQSYDGNPQIGDEEVFPKESLPEGQCHGPWGFKEVIDFLWRNGKVPEWINIAVTSEDGQRTVVALRCCGRFTAQEELLYHRYIGGVPPFSIKSANLPPGWESVEDSGKFDLYWEEKRTHR